MNLSTRLLSVRITRSLLFVVAVVVIVGFLLAGDAAVLRVLGAVGALLIAVLLKVVSELFVQLRQLQGVASQLAETSTRMAAETRSLIQEGQRRMARVEGTFADAEESFSRAQEQAKHRYEDLSRTVEDLATKLDEVIAAQQPSRRHVLSANDALRELGLRESLTGLSSSGDAESIE